MATSTGRKAGRDGSRAVRDALAVVALLAVATTFSVSVDTTRAPGAADDPAPATVGIPDAVAAAPVVHDADPAETTATHAHAAPHADVRADARADARAVDRIRATARDRVRETIDEVLHEVGADPSVVPDVVRAFCAENGRCEMRLGDVHVVLDLPNLG